MTLQTLRSKTAHFQPQVRTLLGVFIVSCGVTVFVLHATKPSSRALLLIWVVYLLIFTTIVSLLLCIRSIIKSQPIGRKSLLKLMTLATAPILLLILSSLGQVSFGSVLFLVLFLGLLVFYIGKL